MTQFPDRKNLPIPNYAEMPVDTFWEKEVIAGGLFLETLRELVRENAPDGEFDAVKEQLETIQKRFSAMVEDEEGPPSPEWEYQCERAFELVQLARTAATQPESDDELLDRGMFSGYSAWHWDAHQWFVSRPKVAVAGTESTISLLLQQGQAGTLALLEVELVRNGRGEIYADPKANWFLKLEPSFSDAYNQVWELVKERVAQSQQDRDRLRELDARFRITHVQVLYEEPVMKLKDPSAQGAFYLNLAQAVRRYLGAGETLLLDQAVGVSATVTAEEQMEKLGSVAGLDYKIDAAYRKGLELVLVSDEDEDRACKALESVRVRVKEQSDVTPLEIKAARSIVQAEALLSDRVRRRARVISEYLSANISDATSINPATLLNAKYEVVPFDKNARQTELSDLEGWRHSEDQMSIRLFYGAGGSGKTRLFIEWCKQLRRRKWIAGFLKDEGFDKEIDRFLALPRPTLVVIDYAESRPRLGGFIEGVVGKQASGGVRLRVALLAREVGDWWRSLCGNESIRHLLLAYRPKRLRSVAGQGHHRRRVVEDAAAVYAEKLKKPVPVIEMDFEEDQFGRMLYLQMAALAAVEGLKVRADLLLDQVLVHEKQYWLKRYQEQFNRDNLVKADFLSRASRVISAVTLRGGVSTPEMIKQLNKAVCGPGQEQFLRFLMWLYPGEKQSEHRGHLSPLEPDLLGEALVVDVLTDADTPSDYLQRVFSNADVFALETGFKILGQISANKQTEGRRWLSQIFEQDAADRLMPAFDAAMSLGKKSAHSVLGSVLAEKLDQAGTHEHAMRIYKDIPDRTASLGEVAVWATKKLLDELHKTPESLKTLRERAQLLSNLGGRLGQLRRPEEALASAQKAVDIYRVLVQGRPGVFSSALGASLKNPADALYGQPVRMEPLASVLRITVDTDLLSMELPGVFLGPLANSLINLGVNLREMGRREEALAATEEAVDIRRKLVQARQDSFLPYLARDLDSMAVDLRNLYRYEKALETAEEAVKIQQGLKKDRDRSDLASSLHSLSLVLGDLGRHEEALAATEKALNIRRKLAKKLPDSFLPHFATSLDRLGANLISLRRHEEALAAAEKAVKIRRELTSDRDGVFQADLASSLNRLCSALADLGRYEKALAAMEEAVSICRKFAQELPNVFLPRLADILTNLGGNQIKLGKREDALAATQEAIDIYRKLEQNCRGAFRPNLATSLNNAGIMLSDLSRSEDALAAAEEAVQIRRELAHQNQGAFLPRLAHSLHNLGHRYRDLGKRAQALAAADEAVNIQRMLVKTRPKAFLPDLARYIGDLVAYLYDSGNTKGALDVIVEGIKILEPLFEAAPSESKMAMVSLIGSYCRVTQNSGEVPDDELSQAITRYGDDSVPAVRNQMARALVRQGVALNKKGRFDESLAVYIDCVKRFGNDTTAMVRDQVATALLNQGITLQQIGRIDESLTAYVECARRFSSDDAPVPREKVVVALSCQGVVLGLMGRFEESMTVYVECVNRFGDGINLTAPDSVALVLVNQGTMLMQMGRYEESLVAFGECVDRFGDSTAPSTSNLVAGALYSQGLALGEMGRSEESIAAHFAFLDRSSDAIIPALRDYVASAQVCVLQQSLTLWKSSLSMDWLSKAIDSGRRAYELNGSCYDLACALAVAGELEEAFFYLQESLKDKQIEWSYVHGCCGTEGDPDWDHLRSDPRYLALESIYKKQCPPE
jgi:tetratricopeptide (TPR) repeat protein